MGERIEGESALEPWGRVTEFIGSESMSKFVNGDGDD